MFIPAGGREAERGKTRLLSLQPVPLEGVGIQSLQVEEMISFLWEDIDSQGKQAFRNTNNQELMHRSMEKTEDRQNELLVKWVIKKHVIHKQAHKHALKLLFFTA